MHWVNCLRPEKNLLAIGLPVPNDDERSRGKNHSVRVARMHRRREGCSIHLLHRQIDVLRWRLCLLLLSLYAALGGICRPGRHLTGHIACSVPGAGCPFPLPRARCSRCHHRQRRRGVCLCAASDHAPPGRALCAERRFRSTNFVNADRRWGGRDADSCRMRTVRVPTIHRRLLACACQARTRVRACGCASVKAERVRTVQRGGSKESRRWRKEGRPERGAGGNAKSAGAAGGARTQGGAAPRQGIGARARGASIRRAAHGQLVRGLRAIYPRRSRCVFAGG